MNDTINFALIGAGFIGTRHAEIIMQNPGMELVAICDVKPNYELKIKNYEGPFFNSLETMLETERGIDVVSIATPNGLHAEHALAALNAGKHVLIEKPIALTGKDARAIIQKAGEVNKKVFCVMQNRFSPPAAWLKQILSEGRLGKIFMVQVNCYWNRDDRYYKKGDWKGTNELDGGTLFTQFSHFIDIMYWLFGDIKNVHTRFRDFTHTHSTEFEDSGFVHFDFVNGGMGCINYSTALWDKNFESSITVISEKGTVKIGGQYMDRVEYCHINDYTMPDLAESNPPNNYGQFKGSASNHGFVFDNISDVIQRGKELKISADDAVKVTEIIEGFYKMKKA